MAPLDLVQQRIDELEEKVRAITLERDHFAEGVDKATIEIKRLKAKCGESESKEVSNKPYHNPEEGYYEGFKLWHGKKK